MEIKQWTNWEAVLTGILVGLIAGALVMVSTFQLALSLSELLPRVYVVEFLIKLNLVIFGVELIFCITGALVGKFIGKTGLAIVMGSIIGSFVLYGLVSVGVFIWFAQSGLSF